jgi:hypothetical protein
MALLERLQILVDGNASGAIREFQKVGAVADRELGRTEDKLTKLSSKLTSFGTGLIAGGAVAISGLKTLADSASAYSEQVSAATVTFGEQGAAELEKFAEAAADTANISKTEATKAANGFAVFARQAGLTGTAAVKFSTDLVQLAGDLASFKDITVEEALGALQSGLAGESEPIRRLGGDISDVAIRASLAEQGFTNLGTTLTAQQKIIGINAILYKDFANAQGDAVRTSDSLANQTRNAQANFENLKTQLGQSLVPIFGTVVGGLNDIITKFSELPEGVKGPLGALAGIGAFGAVAVGALSLVAGQAIKFRDAFTTTTTTVVDGVETQRRSMTKLGQAAVVFGKLTTALAVSEATFAAINAGTGAIGEFETALDRVAVASTQGGASIEQAFAQAAGAQDDVLELQNVWTDFGARVVLTADGTKGSIEDVQQTFDALSKTNPQLAGQVLDQLQLVTNGLDRNSDQWKTNQEFIDKNREALGLAAGAAEVNGTAVGAAGDAAAGAAGQIDGMTGAAEEQVDTFEKVRAALKKYDEQVAFLTVNYEALTKRADEYTAAIERSTRLDDEIESAADLGTALADVRENIAALPKEIDTAKLAFGGYNEEQLKSIDSLLKLGDASGKFIESLFEQNYTIDEIRFAAGILREEYKKQFEQLGLNEEQVDKYLTVLGLTPDQVDTAITLSGEEEARFKIEAYQALIEGTPPEKLTEFYAELAEGDYIAAAEKLDELAKDRTATITIEQRIAAAQTVPGAASANVSAYEFLVWAALGGNKEAAAALNALGAVGAAGGTGAGFPQRARGGPVAANQMYVVGEEGPEMFVPRTSGTIVPNGQLQGGTVNLTQNITTGDPILTAAEVVRRQRDAEFLAGV